MFYLNSYSIENLLISKSSFCELIKEKFPKLKDENIDLMYSYNDVIKKVSCLKELATIFIVIQEFELGKSYYKINTTRDFNVNTDFSYRGTFIRDYINLIEATLKSKDKRYTLNAKGKKYKNYFTNTNLQLTNIPGKHLLCLINDILKSMNLINQYSLESLTYKLAKESNLTNFTDLKSRIEYYIQN